MEPQRIKKYFIKQLQENAKSVTRPGRWGNPYKVTDYRTAAEAVALFKDDLLAGRLRTGKNGRYHITVDYVREHLRGFNLACLCDLDAPCHGDVLLAIANG